MKAQTVAHVPAPEQEVRAIDRLERWAAELTIQTPEQYEASVNVLKQAKGASRRIRDFFAPMKGKAHAAWREICDNENAFVRRLDAVERRAKGVMVAYQQREEAKRRAEQARLQAEADERARKEAERLAARAEKAEEKGKAEKAEMLREQAAMVSAPVVQVSSAVPKVQGTATRTNWKAKLVNLDALIAAAATGNSLARSFLAFDQKAADAFARASKGGLDVAGVEWAAEESVAIRAE